jgi:hypothetical protein
MSMPSELALKLAEKINQYEEKGGENPWEDVIYPTLGDQLDEAATQAADPSYASDVVFLRDGSRVEFDYDSHRWVAR